MIVEKEELRRTALQIAYDIRPRTVRCMRYDDIIRQVVVDEIVNLIGYSEPCDLADELVAYVHDLRDMCLDVERPENRKIAEVAYRMGQRYIWALMDTRFKEELG